MDKRTKEYRRKLGYDLEEVDSINQKPKISILEKIDNFVDQIENFVKAIGRVLLSVLGWVFWLAIAAALIALFIYGFSALPVSAAIIIGAIIIASSLNR